MATFNLNDTTPAAPSGKNVKWQSDTSSPKNISAYVPPCDVISLGVIQLAGDLSGYATSPVVVGLQGKGISSTAPTDGQVLRYVAADNQWEAVTYNPLSIYPSVVLAEASIINYLRFEESSGTNALDSTPNNRYGSLFGTVQMGVNGRNGLGRCYGFNGTNAYVTFPRNILDDFTIEFWFMTTASAPAGTSWTGGWGLVNAETNGYVLDFGVSLCNGGQVYFGVGTTVSNTDYIIKSTKTNYNDGIWHHVAATRVKTTGALALWIDGQLAAQGTPSSGGTSSLTAPATISVGRLGSQNSGYFNGYIDEVATYNAVLTQNQVFNHYRAADPINNATQLQGINISGNFPTDGQILKYNAINNDYEPVDPPGALVLKTSTATVSGVTTLQVSDGTLSAGAPGVAVIQTGGGSGGGGGFGGGVVAALPPDAPPATPDPLDDEFNGTSLNTNTWTTIANAGTTLSVQSGRLTIASTSGSGNYYWQGVFKTRPNSTPFEVTAKLSHGTMGNVVSSQGYGLLLRESSSGKLVAYRCYLDSSNTLQMAVINYPNTTGAASSTAIAQVSSNPYMPSIYLRVKDDGTNFIFSFSYDGINFTAFGSVSRTAYLTASYDQVGFGLYEANSTAGSAIAIACDWFRRTDGAYSPTVPVQLTYVDNDPVDAAPSNPTQWDDEFNATTLDPKWTVKSGTSAPAYSISNGRLILSSGTANSLNLIQSKPAVTPFEITMKMRYAQENVSGNASAGIFFGDGTKRTVFTYGYISSVWKAEVENWTDYQTWASNPYSSGLAWGQVRAPLYMRIRDDGTNLIFSVSLDNIFWTQLTTVARLSWLSQITEFGVYGAASCLASIEWIRRTDGTITPKTIQSDINAAVAAAGALPAGGTTGQVLTKKSGSNYDTQWADGGTGGGGAGSIITATSTPDNSVGSDGDYCIVAIGGSSVTPSTLASVILADSPWALWKGDEGSGSTLSDSSGNVHHLTLTNPSTTIVLQKSNIIPSMASTSFLMASNNTTDFASITGTGGLSMPFVGDATWECVVMLRSSQSAELFAIGTSGEAENTNWQFGVCISGVTSYIGNLEYFHEYGAGNDQRMTSVIFPTRGIPLHLTVRRIQSSKTIDFFINGAWCDSKQYTNDPTGGTSSNIYGFGTYSNSAGAAIMGYQAFYTKALSNAQIVAHAIASGVVRG